MSEKGCKHGHLLSCSLCDWDKVLTSRDNWQRRAMEAEARATQLSIELTNEELRHASWAELSNLQDANERLLKRAIEAEARCTEVTAERDYAVSVAASRSELLRAYEDRISALEADGNLEHVGACSAHQEPCHQCWLSAKAETIARVVTALNALSDQYFEGDMVEQCDFTAEGIAIAADWIREGKWKEKEG